jgi:hypothetical protein
MRLHVIKMIAEITARTHTRCLAATLCCLALSVGACKDEPKELTIRTPERYWSENGFAKMVPPVRLPGREHGRDRTQVWLKLPKGSRITTRWLPDQARHVLEYPDGTIADRVEYWARGDSTSSWEYSVADVRGTRLASGKEFFHAYRPIAQRLHAPLRGFEWSRDDDAMEERATERLVEMVAALSSAARRAQTMERARYNYDCKRCHVHSRRNNAKAKEYGFVNRGTDAAGFVLIQTVLSNEVPIETYFPVERNQDDPFIRFVCGDQRTSATQGHNRVPTCSDGHVPTGVLDVAAALKAGDGRVKDLCASRKYLFDHMEPSDRAVFQERFAECGLAVSAEKSRDSLQR